MRYISFRFSPEYTTPLLFDRAYFASWGRIPRFTNVEVREELLILRPDISGTGTVHLPMEHPQFGIMLQASDTLRQREKPYNLLKELGRGKLGRLMRSLYEWHMNGFETQKSDHNAVQQILHDFGVMATFDENADETHRTAKELLQRLDHISLNLFQKYFTYTQAVQKQRFQRHPNQYKPLEIGLLRTTEVLHDLTNTVAATPTDSYETDTPEKEEETGDTNTEKNRDVETAEYLTDILLGEDTTKVIFEQQIDDLFEYVAAIPCWKDIEPQQGQFRFEFLEEQIQHIEHSGRKAMIGPVLTFDPAMIPRWALNRIDQREAFENAALNFAIRVAKRFGRRCSRWIVSSRIFSAPKCGFSVGRGVSLICDVIEEIKNTVPKGMVLAAINQPFGDFYCSYSCPLPYIAIIESLASVSTLDGFLLELHLGMNSNNTYLRDPISFSRMFDLWGLWRKKMYLSLSISDDWNFFPQPWSPTRISQVQSEWIHVLMQICLLKRNIHGIYWDALPHATPLFEKAVESLLPSPNKFKP